jgi:hypothetical protein
VVNFGAAAGKPGLSPRIHDIELRVAGAGSDGRCRPESIYEQ